MSNNNDNSMDEPLDFLLKPELMKKFAEMLEKRIAAGEDNLAQVNDQRKQIEDAIRGLKSNLETLQKYIKFVDLKGYAHTKQEADTYFKEMADAQTTRLSAEEPQVDPFRTPHVHIPDEQEPSWSPTAGTDQCGEYYQLGSLLNVCIRVKGHAGECGPGL